MGLSAPPASWGTVLNKPTTVSGFGITDMGSQSVASATNASNASNANTVSSITTQQVLNASSSIVQNSVGSYGVGLFRSETAFNGLIAAGNIAKIGNGGTYDYAGYAGTWRNLGGATGAFQPSCILRIA